MPAKKSRPRNTTPGLSKSIARGRSQAKEIVALRARQLKKRERAIAALPPQRRLAAAKIPDARREALGSQTIAGLLIAEGDSWFDYPLHDVLSLLEDEHGYEVESVAHKGDRVEDMAYTGGQFEEFARRLEKLLRHGRVPDAILLSGGMLRESVWLAAEVRHRMAEVAPRGIVRLLTEEPAIGAIRLAIAEARGGVRVPPYIETLRSTPQ